MPDYKAMYFELFRASVQAVQLLQDAQAHAEQQLLAEDPPPLRLASPSPPRLTPCHLAPRFVAYATSLPSWGESVKGRGKSFTVTFLALPLGELARSA